VAGVEGDPFPEETFFGGSSLGDPARSSAWRVLRFNWQAMPAAGAQLDHAYMII